MQFSKDVLNKWENLINEVNKTEVPLECIKKVIVKLAGKRQHTINLHTLRKQGLDIEEIEMVLTRKLAELGDDIRDLDFVVDIVAVAEIVQPETDKLLNGL
jgi:hypothetical protein